MTLELSLLGGNKRSIGSSVELGRYLEDGVVYGDEDERPGVEPQ